MAPRTGIVGWFTTFSLNKDELEAYAAYLRNHNARIGNEAVYSYLEKATARRFNGIARGGNEKLIPDILIEDESLVKLFQDKLGINDNSNSIEIELKSKTLAIAPTHEGGTPEVLNLIQQWSRTETGVGQSKISDNLKNATKRVTGIATIADAAQALNANEGAGWFKLLKSKDPELFKAFHHKARLLQINYKLGASVTALTLYTPINSFKVPPFKFYYSRGTLYSSLNNAYEKAFLTALQNTKPIALDNLEQFKEDFAAISFGKKPVKIQGGKTLTIKVPTGGSIPLVKGVMNVSAFDRLVKKSGKSNAHRFIKSAELTALVQARLGNTMQKFGNPNPPYLKERSGRFRASVSVVANYRSRMIAYSYNPLYNHLEQYGYRPKTQVEQSIRSVVQALFASKMNIVYRGL